MKVCAKGKQYPKKSAYIWGFPGGPAVKIPPCYAGDLDSILFQELGSHTPRGK